MTDCSKIPTLDDINAAKENMDFIDDWVESPNYSETTPDNVSKRTITGINADASAAIASITLLIDNPIRPWSPFLLVDDYRAHENNGIVYAPLPELLPFTTGATFDESNWYIVQGVGDIDNITVAPVWEIPTGADGIETDFTVPGSEIYEATRYIIELDGARQNQFDTSGVKRWNITGTSAPFKVSFVTPPDESVEVGRGLWQPVTTQTSGDPSDNRSFNTVADLKVGAGDDGKSVDFPILAANKAEVSTSNYYSDIFGGGSTYSILTAAAYGGTPDGLLDFYVGGGVDYVAKAKVVTFVDARVSGIRPTSLGPFDNEPSISALMKNVNVAVIPEFGGVGFTAWNFDSVPLMSPDATIILENGTSDSVEGITLEQLQAMAFNSGYVGGVPMGTRFKDAKYEIIAGTIRQQQFKNVTITSSGTTATVVKTAHGYPDGANIYHVDATEPEYNGYFSIFNVTSDTYDFTMTAPTTSPATGTPRAKRPAQWDFIEDSLHHTTGVDTSSPVIAVGDKLQVPYNKTYGQTITTVVGADEYFGGTVGSTMGQSSGLSFFALEIGLNKPIVEVIRYNESGEWVHAGFDQQKGVRSLSFSPSGILSIGHDYAGYWDVSLTAHNNSDLSIIPYEPVLDFTGVTSTEVLFMNQATRTYVTTPDKNMCLLFKKKMSGSFPLDGSNGSHTTDLSLGNVWFYGFMGV